MFQLSKCDFERGVIIFLLAFILFLNWFGFLLLDKKIDRALEQQEEINQSSYETNKEQSKSIRVLHTDVDVLMRLATKGIYTEEE